MLRRARLPGDPKPAPLPPDPFDIELVPVTRLEVVLDNGLPLAFDLEKERGDSFKEDPKRLTVKLGKRTLRIREHRILYTETRPHQMKRPLTPEQISAIKQK